MRLVRIAIVLMGAFASLSTWSAAFAQCGSSTSTSAGCYGTKFKATKNSLLGWRLLQEKKYKAAIEAYTRAIQESPNDPSNYNNRADAYNNSGDQLRALADYTTAIKMAPRDDLYYNNRAAVHSDRQDFALAKADLETALSINPKAWVARWKLADMHHNIGNSQAALDILGPMIATKPKDPIVYMVRGVVNRDMGRPAEALADLKCTEIFAKDARCFAFLADVHQIRGDADKASAALATALRLDQNSGLAYRVRADIKLSKGDHLGAVLDYTKAFDLDPTNVLALLRRGDALMQMGRTSDGVTDYDTAANIDQRNARELAFRKEARTKAENFRQTMLEHYAKSAIMIFFDYGLTDITDAAQPLVDTATKILAGGLAKTVAIVGHSDASEFKDDPNIANARAFAVRSALLRAGAAPEKIKIGVGKQEEALVPTPPGTKEPQTRRVVLTFVQN